MKYVTWKVAWSNEIGLDPTSINSDDIRFEPQFATGDLQDSETLVYAYLTKGDIDLNELSQWSVAEITLDNMLNEAKKMKPDCVSENGFIKFPRPDYN